MRVISGSCRGRKLIPISGIQIRPTSDRVKEAIFNIIGPGIYKKKVLDLFCGTGALGIEALSRGAAQVVFVDADIQTVNANLEHCGLTGNASVFPADLLTPKSLNILKNQRFDYIFLDPPYGKKNIEMLLRQPQFMDLLHPDSLVIAEHGAKESLDIQQSRLDIFRQKKYSKTMISLIKRYAQG